MPYPFPLNLELLLVKEESSYGVDASPVAGTDAIRHIKHLWPNLGSEWAFPNMREDVVTNTLIEAEPGQPRGRLCSFGVDVELKGAGVAYDSSPVVRPEVDPFLTSSGLLRTHDDTGAAEKVTYTLADSGHASATVYAYAGGKLMIVTGCRSNLIWTMTAGMLGRMRFEVQGLLQSIADSDPPPAGTYDTTESPAAVNMGLSINPGTPWTPNFTEAVINLGNNIVRLDDGNGADGLEGFFIPSRQPRFNLSARTELLSTYNPEALRITKTLHTIDGALNPSTQYNRVLLDSNDARLAGTPRRTEDNEFAGWELEYMLRHLAIIFS